MMQLSGISGRSSTKLTLSKLKLEIKSWKSMILRLIQTPWNNCLIKKILSCKISETITKVASVLILLLQLIPNNWELKDRVWTTLLQNLKVLLPRFNNNINYWSRTTTVLSTDYMSYKSISNSCWSNRRYCEIKFLHLKTRIMNLITILMNYVIISQI